MANLRLTMATYDYDHVRDLASGEIRPQGIDLTSMCFRVEEIFYRFANTFEWDVSELSFAKYCSMMSYDEPPITGIPRILPARGSEFRNGRKQRQATPAD